MDKAPKIEVFGIKELDNFFKEMKRTDQRRLFLDSIRLGTKPLVAAARTLLRSKMRTRSKTNNLYKSIGFVAGRSRGKSVFISAKVGARRYGNYRGFHGHLYDAGTSSRQTKQGFKRGTMPESGFFTDALRTTEPIIIGRSQDNIIKALDKYIQRNLKRMEKVSKSVNQ